MIKIDAHMHVNFNGFNTNDIIAYMDTNRIDQSWLLSWEEINPFIPAYYKHLPIDQVMDAYYEYPNRIIPMYAPDPCRDDWESRLEKYIEQGIRGYGELKVSLEWDAPEINSVLTLLQKRKIPILFHMQGAKSFYVPSRNHLYHKILSELLNAGLNGWPRKLLFELMHRFKILQTPITPNLKYFPGYLLDFQKLEQKLIEFPDVTFIGHGPYFWRNIAQKFDMDLNFDRGKISKRGCIWRLLETYDNLYADVSGKSGYNALTRDSDCTRIFLEKFYKKILFGTDNFLLGLEEYISGLGLPLYKLQRIFGLNASEIISPK